MAYRLKRQESVLKGVKRIAREQIEQSLDELRCEAQERHETVHQIRMRCKKVRGLIRLVQPVFESYQEENAFFRDAARRLSTVRDAESRIESFDKLLQRFGGQVDRGTFEAVRQVLIERKQRLADEELEEELAEFEERIHEARERVDAWTCDAKGFDALCDGVAKTYDRGRSELMQAYGEPTAERLHQWRKRVKYHWYHTRLLRDVWRPIMQARREELKRLADLLGDARDLLLLHETLSRGQNEFESQRDVEALQGLISAWRAELLAEAFPLGRRIFAEKPKHLARRLARYWISWRETSAAKARFVTEEELLAVS